jgi:hypothetical protein
MSSPTPEMSLSDHDPPTKRRKQNDNAEPLKSYIAANRKSIVVATSKWDVAHLYAFNVKVHSATKSFLESLPPGVVSQVESVTKGIHQEMEGLEEKLPNLRSHDDSDIRRVCSDSGSGEYSSLMVCLAEILCLGHEKDDENSDEELGGDGHEQEQMERMGKGVRRSTRNDGFSYGEPSDDDEPSQHSSYSLTDLDILKKRAHTESLTARLAIEFLGLACWKWREGCGGTVEGYDAQFLFSDVFYTNAIVQC